MTDTQIQEAINAFHDFPAPAYQYPSIQEYEFTPEDREIISREIKTYKDYDLFNCGFCMCGMQVFIGNLARDRVNEKGDALPILSWD